MSLFSLSDRVALVTGGNSGIGLAIARGYIDAGASVAIAGRDREKNKAAQSELGQDATAYELDVREEQSVQKTIQAVFESFGRLDILINNAGNYRDNAVVDKPLTEWEDVMSTHLTGAFLCSRESARVMIRGGRGGKIINIGSMYSIFGAHGGADYASAKSGMLGLTRTLANELAEHSIQANAILPGWIDTPMCEGLPATKRGEEIRRKTPAARWGVPNDLIGTAVFLASAGSDFVTGIAIPVDGGYSVSEQFM